MDFVSRSQAMCCRTRIRGHGAADAASNSVATMRWSCAPAAWSEASHTIGGAHHGWCSSPARTSAGTSSGSIPVRWPRREADGRAGATPLPIKTIAEDDNRRLSRAPDRRGPRAVDRYGPHQVAFRRLRTRADVDSGRDDDESRCGRRGDARPSRRSAYPHRVDRTGHAADESAAMIEAPESLARTTL